MILDKMNGLGWDEAVAWTDTEQTGGKGAIEDTRVPECTVHSIKGYQCTACKCTNSVLGFQCTIYQYTSIPAHSLPIYQYISAQCARVPRGHQQCARAFLKIWWAGAFHQGLPPQICTNPTQPCCTKQTRPFKKKTQRRKRPPMKRNKQKDHERNPWGCPKTGLIWEECELNSWHSSLSSDGSNRSDSRNWLISALHDAVPIF